jgi:hypothetical protein
MRSAWRIPYSRISRPEPLLFLSSTSSILVTRLSGPYFKPTTSQKTYGLKQGDALSPLLFNYDLEYAIRKVQENQLGLKLDVTHQLLAYTDDVNLLGDNIDTIKENMETWIDASKEVGLEINIEKTKYMLLSRHQNIGQNRNIKIANRSFENVP